LNKNDPKSDFKKRQQIFLYTKPSFLLPPIKKAIIHL
jgi:hypothetical protein